MKLQRPSLWLRRRSEAALFAGAVMLILAIVGPNLVFLRNSQESTLQTAEADLARYSLTLAEQADRSFKSLDLVLSSVGDYLGRKGVTDETSYRQLVADYSTYLFLKEKITGLPQVDAITMIDSTGKLLNFSRYWPIPDVNVSDRDYFQALKADSNLETFVSKPALNRGTGTWNIYLARRLNGPNGEFMGLILGATSLQYFENFFGVTSIGTATTISLTRNDGILLARFPHSTEIGQATDGSEQRALAAGGIVREAAPGQNSHLRSARNLPNYPLSIATSQDESAVLVGWRRMAELLTLMSAVCVIVVVIGTLAIDRWWKAQQHIAEAADTANRAKSTFLAMMSHEIRTPMNAVLGFAGALSNTGLTPEQRSAVTAIHEAGDGLLEILNDILDFSKFESGKLSLESVAFAPAAIIHNAVSILRPRATAKGLTIRTTDDATLPRALRGDAGRIRQMLINLVANAIKFTETGEVMISARCLHLGQDTARVEWSVSDTGIGIAPERIKDLFQDFVQADPSISRRFGGSGLGLAICKRLVEQMKGEINVTSELGRGSKFSFILALPVVDLDLPVDRDTANPAAEIATKIAAVGRPLRILIADDNATNRLVAAKMLKEFNIQTSMACNGIEALEAATRFSYDMILMDMRMPEMDGLQATRAIRASGGRLASVPIVAFTANAFAEDIQACREAGMMDVVVKPVRKQVLIETIARILEQVAPGGAEVPTIAAPPIVELQPEPWQLALPLFTLPGTDIEEHLPPRLERFDRYIFDMLGREIGTSAASELVAFFFEETEGRLSLLRQPAETNGRDFVAREAHALKSAAAAFGFAQLAGLALELERAATRIDEAGYKALVDDIGSAFATARQQFSNQSVIVA